MTPTCILGLLMVMLRSVMFLYDPPMGALHSAKGIEGQQRLQGCAAHRLLLSDCWAGPIQIGHWGEMGRDAKSWEEFGGVDEEW